MKKRYFVPAYTSEVAEKTNRGIRFIARAYTKSNARLIASALNEMEVRDQILRTGDCIACGKTLEPNCYVCMEKRGELDIKRRTK